MAKGTVLGVVICNWLVMFALLGILWCTFDRAGRSWVKLKASKKQEAMKRSKSRVERRQSRAKLYVAEGRAKETAQTDRRQPIQRYLPVFIRVPITPQTKHLNLMDPVTKEEFKDVLYYFKYAVAAYGWPLYMIMNKATGLCKLAQQCRCCCCNFKNAATVVDEDNCCQCNFTALKRQLGLPESEITYATFHSADLDSIEQDSAESDRDFPDGISGSTRSSTRSSTEKQSMVSETPFFIAVDHKRKTIVISVRGTLSLQDCLTDLSADISHLPLDGVPDDWLGHKGMVEAAVYIQRKLKSEFLLAQAFGHDKDRGTHNYDLVLVGHSLGAGTAAILAILLRPEFPSLYCYAYSPPGGLLSMPAVEHTKEFMTSVVVGKDIVMRIGLAQMEYMRSDLISCIKRSQDPKWLIISGGIFCCCKIRDVNMQPSTGTEDFSPSPTRVDVAAHPSDLSIMLSTHVPLYPPGKIIHVVRNHPKGSSLSCGRDSVVYHALWAENTAFDEVLVSPVMVNDHLPYNVMDALEKCLLHAEQGKRALDIQYDDSDSGSSEPLSIKQSHANHETHLQREDDILRNGYHDPDRRTVSTLSWEFPTSDDKEGCDHVVLRRQEYYGDRHSGKQSSEISNDMESSSNGEWVGKAPLARPESLSASSSMYSVVSESRKSSMNAKAGKPFRQEGYCYYVDPVDSPEEAYGKTFPSAGPYGRNQITTLATIEGTPTHFASHTSPTHQGHKSLPSRMEYMEDSMQTMQSSDSGVVTAGDDIPMKILTMPLPVGSPPPKPPRLNQAKLSQDNPPKVVQFIEDLYKPQIPQFDMTSTSSLPVSPAPTLGRGYTEYLPLTIDPDFDDGVFSPIARDDEPKETDRLTSDFDNDGRTFVTSTPNVKRHLGSQEYDSLRETKC
ncbi:diacylglycerol lipase-alpha-like [Ptychodera flava]|uniref:diacylglycerol lipase-alpha-like n=1 Tax=Ptychodera flava TaxID=63121 RepID=UPI00396A0B44